MNNLPEKWYIQMNSESRPFLQEWLDAEYPSQYEFKNQGIALFHFPNYKSGVGFDHGNHITWEKVSNRKDYTEISLDDFKKFVLNKKVEPLTHF